MPAWLPSGTSEEERALVPSNQNRSSYRGAALTIIFIILINAFFIASRVLSAHATQRKQAFDGWDIGRNLTAQPSGSTGDCSPYFYDTMQGLFSLLPSLITLIVAYKTVRDNDQNPNICSNLAWTLFIACIDATVTLFFGAIVDQGQFDCGKFEGWLATNTSSTASNPFRFMGNWFPSRFGIPIIILGALSLGNYIAAYFLGNDWLAKDKVLCKPPERQLMMN